MKEVKKSEVNDGKQHVCTYEYGEDLFAITFVYSNDMLYIMNETRDYEEDSNGLEFDDNVENIQYWSK